MKDNAIKKYALTGLLVRISREKETLKKTKDTKRKEQIQNNIDTMQNLYNDILDELKEENPL